MTITAAFCPRSGSILFDANANPIVGGQVFAFDAETTNPRTVYRDRAMTTPHPTPVLTDAFGNIPTIWVGLGDYKLVLQDAEGGSIATIDDLPGGTDDSADVQPIGTTIPTGFVMPAHTDDIVSGWLPLNGKTIGSAGSSASSRANDDTQALFVKLWNKDPSLTVLGGRGVSATADFNSAKTISLPDYRGRTVFGADSMGSTPAGVITTATSSAPDQIGNSFGSQAVPILVDQLPNIAPTITINAAGGYTPTGSTTSVGDHQHGGTTDYNGDHQHSYTDATATTGNRSGTDSPCYAPSPASHNTGTAGGHTHTFTTGAAGGHAHSLSINAVPDHVHIATASPLGQGNVHANMPPGVTGYWHIKL